MRDQGGPFLALDPEGLEPLRDVGLHLVAGQPVRQAKVPPQKLQDRVIGDRGTVG